MKVLTNENNTNTLKIIISSKICKKKIEIVKDVLERLDLYHPKKIPQLVLDSGIHIFSSNASAKFLLPPSIDTEHQVNYYLDFEATILQPLVAAVSAKIVDKSKLEKILHNLNLELLANTFLCGNNLTVADISVWCTLYPVFTDSKCKSFFNNLDSLRKWFSNFETHEAVKDSLRLFSISNSLESAISSQLEGKAKPNLPTPQKVPSSSLSSEKIVRENTLTVTNEEKKGVIWKEKYMVSSPSKKKPVLPVPGERNILITAALPYVNNVPHLGNIIGCVLSGDVFARYCRLRGFNTLFICGTDEYGTATETKAIEEGLTPKEICDKYFKIHDSIYKWFNIEFDHFGRTSNSEQTEICQDIFKKVYNNGYILSNTVEQLLCEKCDRYLADRFVEGVCPKCAYEDARGDQCDGCGHLINAPELIKPRCKMCQKTPVLRQSKQFFLDLPKIEPLLKDWIQKSWNDWSHNAREISKAWLNDGLKPRCITRDLKWGIPVPLEGYENKVFYVWFDAPIGYLSITKAYTNEWKKWWMPEKNTKVSLYQFMAKDNVPFHSVMFPASLLASQENYVTVNNIFATEYLNYEDGKFSKSRGIGVFGNDAQDTGIPADVWRFYLLYVRPESQDSAFSWSDLALKNNAELLSTLGNFINRALMFCEKYYDSVVPNIDLVDKDYDMINLIDKDLQEYISMMEKGKLREGIRHLMSIARLGNQLMQASQPWVLCKGTNEDKKRCETVIGLSVNLSCLLALLLDPYMPETATVIRKQLNTPPEINKIEDKFKILLLSGHRLGKPFPLFNKIEDALINQLKTKYSGRQSSVEPTRESNQRKENKVFSASDVSSLEAAVAAQGDVVRKMKASGKTKTEWGPEVTILLDLKKKLAEAEAAVKAQKDVAAEKKDESENPKDIEEMEKKVKEQGDLVRKLKESGAEKSQWQPEVNVLLDLKKQLAGLKGEPFPEPSGKKNKKK